MISSPPVVPRDSSGRRGGKSWSFFCFGGLEFLFDLDLGADFDPDLDVVFTPQEPSLSFGLLSAAHTFSTSSLFGESGASSLSTIRFEAFGAPQASLSALFDE